MVLLIIGVIGIASRTTTWEAIRERIGRRECTARSEETGEAQSSTDGEQVHWNHEELEEFRTRVYAEAVAETLHALREGLPLLTNETVVRLLPVHQPQNQPVAVDGDAVIEMRRAGRLHR